MYFNPHSILFHGTNQRYLDDQLAEHGEYVGPLVPRSYGRGLERKGIYLAENCAGMPMARAIETATNFNSSPIIMISSSQVIGDRVQMGNTALLIYCGWPQELFLTMDVPIKNPGDTFGYDTQKFTDQLRELFDTQTLFDVPKEFDWNYVTHY